MLRLTIILLLITGFLPVSAQYAAQLAVLEKKVNSAENDIERIKALGELGQFYSAFNESNKADSVLHRALQIADLANDKSVITRLLIDNSVSSFTNQMDDEVYNKIVSITQKGIQYAEDMHDNRLSALGYIRLADIFRKRQNFDQALQNTTKAITALSGEQVIDTLNMELFIEIGRIDADKSDPVEAARNYNKGIDIAYRTKNINYQSRIDQLFADLYSSFNHTDKAKQYLQECLQLNRDNNNIEGLYNAYFNLARLTDERDYIDKAIKLAGDLQSPIKLLKARLLLYYWYMVVGKNSEQTFSYLNSNPDLSLFFNNSNRSALCWQRGTIYMYGGIYNSALDCFHASENDLLATRNTGRILDVYSTLAEAHFQNGDIENAAKYFERTYHIADSVSSPVYLDTASKKLSLLYAMKGDYRSAYFYRLKADSIEAAFQAIAASDKLMLLDIDREAKKGEIERLEAASERTRQNNLQITAISILIAVFFSVMLFIGMFEVSKAVIRTLSYFAFISLFEFILLMLDHPITKFTKAEPLRLWFVKIALIAILVPLQHFLEKGLVKFLQSRKLLEARRRFSFAAIFKKKIPIKVESQVTEDEEGEIL